MEKRKEIDGVKLFWTDSGGDGQPVVLMHGWGCNHSTLASIEKVCLDQGCRVINVDFPGFGESGEPAGVWGVEDYTRLIEHLLQAEGINCPTLLGHSFGGRVGILYASRNPVRRLILVDAAGVKPRRKPSYYVKVYTFKLKRRLLTAIMGRDRAEAIIERSRRRKGSADYAAASPGMRRILSKVVNEDLCHVMPRIKAPTLLIWGEADTATPLADARCMEALIPGSGLVSFPGCGHYSFLDNPVQFSAVLRSFLNS